MKKGTVLSLKKIRLSEFIIKNNEILFILKARSICSGNHEKTVCGAGAVGAAVYRRYSGGNLCRGKDSRIVGLFGGLS